MTSGTIQELLGHRDVSTTMIHTHVLNRGGLAARSPLWRTVWDQKNMVLFFDSATTPNTFWVPMKELDFKEGDD